MAVFKTLGALRRSNRAVAAVEFALVAPMLTLTGLGGLEYVNYVLANQKVERIASSISDIVARNTIAPNERNIRDMFASVDLVGKPFKVSARGRTIITGVIGTSGGAGVIVNKITWQRCGGALTSATSGIGTQWNTTSNYGDGPAVTLPNGITLLQNQMAIVAEVTYQYEPLVNLGSIIGTASDTLIKQRVMYVTRGQAFPYLTPIAGTTPANC